jgi:hypothetical protein
MFRASAAGVSYFSVTSERLKFSHLFASVVQASRILMKYSRSSESAASSASVAHLAAVSQAVWLLLVISPSRLLCSKLLQCSSVSPVPLLLRMQPCPDRRQELWPSRTLAPPNFGPPNVGLQVWRRLRAAAAVQFDLDEIQRDRIMMQELA